MEFPTTSAARQCATVASLLSYELLVAGATYAAARSLGGETVENFTIPGAESQDAIDTLDERVLRCRAPLPSSCLPSTRDRSTTPRRQPRSQPLSTT